MYPALVVPHPYLLLNMDSPMSPGLGSLPRAGSAALRGGELLEAVVVGLHLWAAEPPLALRKLPHANDPWEPELGGSGSFFLLRFSDSQNTSGRVHLGDRRIDEQRLLRSTG